jgi:type II secretory pathway predicted ATPase ExeA
MPTPTPPSGLTLRQLAGGDQRVFPSYPKVGRYFPAAAIEDARKRLGRAIERGDGPGLVIGAPGTGKSLLLQVLAAQFHDRFDVVLLASARLCTRRALLQAILFELGLPYKLRDEGELRLSLLDHLLSADESAGGLLLLVDEAQTLPLALLDELRVLTNLVRGDGPRVRVVLAGSAMLEESFAHPELESFSQRLSARCYLAPLGREETTHYIRAQLAASNGSPDDVFAADAFGSVFEATDGVPRLVNQLGERALQFAAANGNARIDCDVIQGAWSDLQQLPTPWDARPAAPAAVAVSQVVEFGGLSDDIRGGDCRGQDDVEMVEPTELDFEDEGNGLVAGTPRLGPAVESHAVDPFAEEFAEEEVVLDNFAAWDDLFRREAPRVENRRDPGFATLVQTAIDVSCGCQSEHIDSSPLGVLRQHDSDEQEEVSALAEPADSSRQDKPSGSPPGDSGSLWPPLRLAVVSDPAPLKPIPLLPPSTHGGAVGAAAFDTIAAVEINQRAGHQAVTESPVLLVEEDCLPSRANPPVRREEYRHLFSRLRSG